ncbi:MAG TPA: tail fiber domain-containing protein [candidate division Zixibacteria bacterium]|nr:tail fiber domain-containing protein [candidate division Zixibacteria bacterium]
MIMRKLSILTLIAVLVSLCPVSATLAQDTLLINYQGYLTDNGGNPVTGTTPMTFTIYDARGVSKWTESHPTVQVVNGLFNVVLGSQTALPDSVFNGDDHFLGIAVGADPEIAPRTLLTAAPGSAVSRRVVGDINTLPGVLEIHPPDPCVPPDPCTPVRFSIYPAASEDLSENIHPVIEMVSVSDTSKFVVHPPDPCVPPEPCNPAVEIAATTDHHSMTINSPPPDDNRPAIKLTANNENMIDLYYPDAESDEGIVQIGANSAEGAFIELHAADSLTATRIMMGGSTADTGFVRLFGGDKDLEFKVLELNSHTNLGGSVKFFDPENIDGREALTIGCSPAADWGIFGFNPQPEPPGHIAFELTSEASQGGRFAVYDTEDANVVLTGGLMQLGHKDITDYPTGTFSVTPTASQLTLTGDASAGDTPTITMAAGAAGVRAGIGTEAPSVELYVVGDITATGAITELSSLKYKTNINQMSDALQKVKDLRGVNFSWRAADYPEMKFPESQQVGLIAEEVEKIVPELVHSDDNGEMSVDYSKLTAVLIEAIKEQQQQIEVLSKRVEELENRKLSNW